jgi:hypothetical protein
MIHLVASKENQEESVNIGNRKDTSGSGSRDGLQQIKTGCNNLQGSFNGRRAKLSATRSRCDQVVGMVAVFMYSISTVRAFAAPAMPRSSEVSKRLRRCPLSMMVTDSHKLNFLQSHSSASEDYYVRHYNSRKSEQESRQQNRIGGCVSTNKIWQNPSAYVARDADFRWDDIVSFTVEETRRLV